MMKKGFTLIELLVVLAIIAILASILFPLYQKAQNNAKRSVCQSNLKQISAGFELYLNDYNSHYPNTNDPYLWMGRHWRWPIGKYVGFTAFYDINDPRKQRQITNINNHVLACPADPTNTVVYDKTSYAYSAAFYHKPEEVSEMTVPMLYDPAIEGPECVSISKNIVKHPSKKVLITEWFTNHSQEKNKTLWQWGGHRNYLFADGHVKYIEVKNIKPTLDNLPDINRTIYGVLGKDID